MRSSLLLSLACFACVAFHLPDPLDCVIDTSSTFVTSWQNTGVSVCPDNRVLRALRVPNLAALNDDLCFGRLSAQTCCKLPTTVNVTETIGNTQINFFSSTNVQRGCSNGAFLRGWAHGQSRSTTGRVCFAHITEAQCLTAAIGGLPNTLISSYKSITPLLTPNLTNTEFAACPVGSYMLTWAMRTTSPPDQINDFASYVCGVPNDAKCSDPPVSVGVTTRFSSIGGVKCDHQFCTATQECQAGFVPDTRSLTCSLTTSSPGAIWTANGNLPLLSCVNINECLVVGGNNCDSDANGGTCTDNVPGFTCGCKPGFTLNPTTRACSVNNECNRTCATQEATDPIGNNCNDCDLVSTQCTELDPVGFSCTCRSGFAPNSNTNACTFIDPCLSNPCRSNSQCVSSQATGSFSCPCVSGFIESGASCVDLNECVVQPGPCIAGNQFCNNTIGSFTCECLPGFRLTAGRCTNIDECVERGAAACAGNGGGQCFDTEGSFFCIPVITTVSLDGSPLATARTLTGFNNAVSLQVNIGFNCAVGDVAVFYGSAGFPTDFACINSAPPTISGALKNFACNLTESAGKFLRLAVTFTSPTGASLVRHTVDLNHAPPSLTTGTLSLTAPGPGGALVTLTSFAETGIDVFMRGSNLFSSFGPQMQLTFNNALSFFECVTPTVTGVNQTVTSGVLSCFTGAGSAANLHFQLTVGRGGSQMSVDGLDVLTFPNAAALVSISGCRPGPNPDETIDCPTLGGLNLTVVGQRIDLPLLLFIGSGVCANPRNVLNGSVFTFTCNLPGGVGSNVPVLLRYGPDQKIAPVRNIVSYAVPTITGVSSDQCAVNIGLATPRLVNCSRVGGTFNVFGSNFGPDGSAAILIDGQAFVPLFISSTQLQVTLPAVNSPRATMSVIARQIGGGVSAQSVTIDHLPCTAGFFVGTGGVCVACPIGQFSTSSDSPSCTACDQGRFQAAVQGTSCSQCPPGRVQPSTRGSSCEPCPPGSESPLPGGFACAACPAGKVSANPASVCVECPSGKSQATAGQSSCVSCSPGKFAATNGQTSCDNCAPGKFSQATTSTICESCAPGSFTGQPASTSCALCTPGSFANAPGLTQCVECLPGRALNLTGSQIACPACVPGKFQSGNAQTSCVACPFGKFSALPGALSCLDCPLGRQSTSPTECSPCQPGEFRGDQSTACEPCAPGRKSDGDASECELCPKGTFQPNASASVCELCPPGTSQGNEGRVSCDDCGQGTVQASPGQIVCLECSPGRFSNQTGVSADCAPCPSGTSQDQQGRTTCVTCSPGTFAPSGAARCLQCVPGFFTAIPGRATCSACPSEALSSSNFAECRCRVGFFARTTAATTDLSDIQYTCTRCPRGAVCDTPDRTFENLETAPAFWRSSNSSLTFVRCVIPRACVGGPQTADGTSPCQANRIGVLCGICEAGFYPGNDNRCIECPAEKKNSALAAGAIFGAIVLLLVLLFYFVLRVSDRQQKGLIDANHRLELSELNALKDLVGNMDLEGTGAMATDADGAAAYDLSGVEDDEDLSALERKRLARKREAEALQKQQQHWVPGAGDAFGQCRPVGLKGILYSHQGVAMDLKQVYKLENSLVSRRAPNFMYKVKIFVGFFQIATIISFLGSVDYPQLFQTFITYFNILNFDFVPWQAVGCATGLDFFGKCLVSCLIPIAAMLALYLFFYLPMFCYDRGNMTDKLAYQQKRKSSWRQFVKLYLFITFLVYPFVSRIVLSLYNCETVENERYLRADFNLKCSDARWLRYAAGLAIFLFLYPVGVPLFYFVLLNSRRSKFRDPGVVLQLGFLYEAYADDRWFWELLDMLHKLTLTGVVAFVPPELQFITCMVVIALYQLAVLLANPFIRKGDDRLQLLAQTELFLLCLVGLVLERPDNTGVSVLFDAQTTDVLVSLVLIAVIVGFLVAFAASTGLSGIKLFSLARRTKKQQLLQGHEGHANEAVLTRGESGIITSLAELGPPPEEPSLRG